MERGKRVRNVALRESSTELDLFTKTAREGSVAIYVLLRTLSFVTNSAIIECKVFGSVWNHDLWACCGAHKVQQVRFLWGLIR